MITHPYNFIIFTYYTTLLSLTKIAKDVTALSEAQRQSNSEYVQIKEQILNIAQVNGNMQKEMKEMKDMIMCIANHLGGVRSENVAQLPLSQNQNQAQQQSQNQSFGQNLSQSQQQWQQQNQQQNANQITNASTAM